ncbi:hypothetical protein E4T42_04475 [Aureobasidium subglaciale]|nr:hypothetical protein E4T42_04475 [Aureobasidium subglaciale]
MQVLYLRFISSIFLLLTCISHVSSSPLLDERATSPQCSITNIAIVRRTVLDESYFCRWWLSDARTKSPFMEFTPDQVTALCKCITTVSSKPKRDDDTFDEQRLEKRQTQASCNAEVSIQFTQP